MSTWSMRGRRSVREPLGVVRCERALSRSRAHQIVLELELLDPARAQDLLDLGVSRSRCESAGLLSNQVVGQRQTSLFLCRALVFIDISSPGKTYLILRPNSQSALDVWRSSLRALDGRAAAIVLQQVFLLLTQDFGDRANNQLVSPFVVQDPQLLTFVRPQRSLSQGQNYGNSLCEGLRTANLRLLAVRVLLCILAHSFSIDIGQGLSRRRSRPCRSRRNRCLQGLHRYGLYRLDWRRIDWLIRRMRLTTEHRRPLRHHQWLQLRSHRSLLDATPERAGFHGHVRRAEIESRVFLRWRSVVRVRIHMRRCGPLSWW